MPAGVKQADATMAVLVQQQLSPDLSFVLHTVSPLDGDKDTMYAELAVGLGETLASGTRGSPWRLAVNKSTGELMQLLFRRCPLYTQPIAVLPYIAAVHRVLFDMDTWVSLKHDL